VITPSGALGLKPLEILDDTRTSALPLAVTGDVAFNVLAVWAHPPYVEDLLSALDTYGALLKSGPAVVVGDFNSAAVFDRKKHPARSHRALVARLRDEFGLVSAYHAHHQLGHGEERHATYFHHWKQDMPFHLDYCFVPADWVQRIRSVDVGTWSAWEGRSDHRPLVVDIDLPSTAAAPG
jgi:endonuclease/exonuclease/phosphatase family metal-dependent hydrolase